MIPDSWKRPWRPTFSFHTWDTESQIGMFPPKVISFSPTGRECQRTSTNLYQSFLLMISYFQDIQASNSLFLLFFSIYLVAYFYFLGWMLACPAISPSPAMLISAGPPPTHAGCPSPSPAGPRSSHVWQNGCGHSQAGGAATTGKDARSP